MDTIIAELEGTLKAGLYYAAISMSLTLPDICASLRASSNSSSGKNKSRYKKWYDEYLIDEFQPMTSEDAYSLRCGVIHQGRLGHKNSSFSKVIFNIPGAMNFGVHRAVHQDVLILNTVDFCVTIGRTSWRWFQDHRDDPIVKSNLDRLVRTRPLGLEPHISGIPVIA